MQYLYVTYKPNIEEQLEQPLQEFEKTDTYWQQNKSSFGASMFFEKGPKTVREQLVDLIRMGKAFTIKDCEILSHYIDFSRSCIVISATPEEIERGEVEAYKSQIINLLVNTNDVDIRKLSQKYKIDYINGEPTQNARHTEYKWLSDKCFNDYTREEIEFLKLFCIEKMGESFCIRYSSVPDMYLANVLKCLRSSGINWKENEGIYITADDRERLLASPYSFKDVLVRYDCDYVSEATEEVIDRFSQALIRVGVHENKMSRYIGIAKYRIILNKLREITSDIPENQSEKKKFKTVYERLANMLVYDQDAVDDNQPEYEEANAKACRNLENALLLGKCVCTGMSETLKQALSLLGIECRNCYSNSDEQGILHAFSLPKIDGVWYNADLTWDIAYIKAGHAPKYCLKSDEEFEKTSEDEKIFHQKDGEGFPKCTESQELFLEEKLVDTYFELVKLLKQKVKNMLTPKRPLLPLSKKEVALEDKMRF